MSIFLGSNFLSLRFFYIEISMKLSRTQFLHDPSAPMYRDNKSPVPRGRNCGTKVNHNIETNRLQFQETFTGKQVIYSRQKDVVLQGFYGVNDHSSTIS